MEAWKLYYDGGCNLCHTSQLRVERWAARAGQKLEVDVLQGEEAISKGYGEAMTLEADGHVFRGADAWLKIMEVAPWYGRWMAILGSTRLTRRVAAFAYGIVARIRYRIWGRRACAMPSPKSR